MKYYIAAVFFFALVLSGSLSQAGKSEDVLVSQCGTGLDNIKGEAGVIGPKGDVGPRGKKGPRGDPGPRGPRGDTGPQGEPGDMGPPGEQGERGPRGKIGPRGPLGLAGKQGKIGGKGLVGDRGPRGDKGPRGPKGPDGPQGPPGPKGLPGKAGKKGKTGKRGPNGPQGPQGPRGDKGPEGKTGPQGPDGPRGPRGHPGEKGDKGKVGATGNCGDRGPERLCETCPMSGPDCFEDTMLISDNRTPILCPAGYHAAGFSLAQETESSSSETKSMREEQLKALKTAQATKDAKAAQAKGDSSDRFLWTIKNVIEWNVSIKVTCCRFFFEAEEPSDLYYGQGKRPEKPPVAVEQDPEFQPEQETISQISQAN